MSDAIDKTLREIREVEAKRTALFERLSALEGSPKLVDRNDPVALRENFAAIAEGRAVVVDSPGPKRRALRANEIDKRDSVRLAKHFEQIKNGLMVVVDKDALEYEEATK